MNRILRFSVGIAALGVLAGPSMLLVHRASAQEPPPPAQQGGGFGGSFPAGPPGQRGFGQPGPQRMNPGMPGQPNFNGQFGMAPPPLGELIQDGENLYVTRGDVIYKISKRDMRITGMAMIPPIQTMMNGRMGGGPGMMPGMMPGMGAPAKVGNPKRPPVPPRSGGDKD